VLISERLRHFREAQNLSQGDLEERTGLLRCYISRVENGHTVPAMETLEKFARALNVSLYQLFYDGNDKVPELENKLGAGIDDWASNGKGEREFRKLRNLLGRMDGSDRKLLMHIAHKMTNGKRRKR